MSNINFTNEQNKAIITRNSNILVSAAAGSGKTAVLVERIMSIITDTKKNVNINNLLIVTFTDAAAKEMKQRISKSIIERLKKEPNNYNLKKQFNLLNNNFIMTIHSFCKYVIKENFHVLDVDPSFRISDTSETELLKEEVINEVLEQEYDNNNLDFLNLVEIYGDKYTDKGLKNLILDIYDFSNNNTNPEKFLKDSLNSFKNLENSPLEESVWADILRKHLKLTLESIILSLEEAINLSSLEFGPYKYIQVLEQDLENIKNLDENLNNTFENILIIINNINFSKLPTIKKDDENVDEDIKNTVKKIRDKEVKEVLKNLKTEVFFKSIPSLKEDIISTYEILKKLVELTFLFKQNFLELKNNKNILDFDDLEHFCIKALANDNIKKSLQNAFFEILIDEYQDSSKIQEFILSSISKKDTKNIFMVGDIKQSIYKFRGSSPELFLEKYDTFEKDIEKGNIRIDLSKNFRSKDIIIDGVNFIFKQIMQKNLGGLSYDKKAMLYTGLDFPTLKENENINISTDIEVNIINFEEDKKDNLESLEFLEELNKTSLEAKFIAKRIHELIYIEKLHVRDDKVYRQANFKDIVILTRTISNVGDVLVNELKNYNIPSFFDGSSSYFENVEIKVFISLLRIIDNPRQDIDLITVLNSFIYNICPDSLLLIRNFEKNNDFYEAINIFIQSNTNEVLIKILTKFKKDLKRWRNLSKYISITDLINTLFKETKYLDYASVLHNGSLAKSNLRLLKDYAKNYENTSYKGIFHFIKYIEKLMKKNAKMQEAKIITESENVVRIMSIHKSKGLEFPIVFISMLGKKFNRRDEAKNIILDKDYGFGPKYIDIENRIKTNTLANFALSTKIQEETYAEEIRILYVAFTRSKEKLILTGTINKLNEKFKNFERLTHYKGTSLPTKYLLKSLNFLDFIIPSLMRHKDLTSSFNITNKGEFLLEDRSKWKINLHDKESILNKNYKVLENNTKDHKKIIDNNLNQLKQIDISNLDVKFNFKYPFLDDTSLPSKISISEIKRNFYKNMSLIDEENIFITTENFREPDFLKNVEITKSKEIGTAIHTVMEHLDILKHTEKKHIEYLINNLHKKNLLTDKEYKIIPIEKILKFLKSDIAKRMKISKNIQKEIPFLMYISSEDAHIKTNSSKKIMVNGVIDCYFEEDDSIILLDYKSDFVNKNNLDSVANKYKIQLYIYKKALENITQKPVKESLIYLFSINDSIKIL